MNHIQCAVVLALLAIAGCSKQEPRQLPQQQPPPAQTSATVSSAAVRVPAVANQYLNWHVEGVAEEYKAPGIVQGGKVYTFEMVEADLDAPIVHFRFKNPAAQETFPKFSGIDFVRQKKNRLKEEITGDWQLGENYIKIAKEIFAADYTFYVGFGMLTNNVPKEHPSMVLVVPAGHYDQDDPDRHFAVVIVHLDELQQTGSSNPTPPPGGVVLGTKQGGVIHGPG